MTAMRAARDEVTRALFEKLQAERDHDVVGLVKARARLNATCRAYNEIARDSTITPTEASA